MSKNIKSRLIPRNGTAATWELINPVLLKGEMGVESDTRRFKFGDGVTPWNDLPYAGESNNDVGGGGLPFKVAEVTFDSLFRTSITPEQYAEISQATILLIRGSYFNTCFGYDQFPDLPIPMMRTYRPNWSMATDVAFVNYGSGYKAEFGTGYMSLLTAVVTSDSIEMYESVASVEMVNGDMPGETPGPVES